MLYFSTNAPDAQESLRKMTQVLAAQRPFKESFQLDLRPHAIPIHQVGLETVDSNLTLMHNSPLKSPTGNPTALPDSVSDKSW